MTDKYGKADFEQGNYLDSAAQWTFTTAGHYDYIVLRIGKYDFLAADGTLPAALRKPFYVTLAYVKGDVKAQQDQQQKQNSGKDL